MAINLDKGQKYLYHKSTGTLCFIFGRSSFQKGLPMENSFKFQKTVQLSRKDFAYESIKQAIISGKLVPGDRLREADIAEQMGISRGPVREAFSRLSQEGLIYSHPYRETVVAEMNPEQIEEIYVPIRRILETYAAEHAYEKLNLEDYEYLEGIIRSMETACTNENLDELTNLDMQFHTYLIDSSANATITALWNIIIAKIHARLLYQGIHHESLAVVPIQHTEYLSYIRSHDMEQIRKHLEEHIY